MKIKGFITNLDKYIESHLVGEWIEFPIDQNELNAVLKRIGINKKYKQYFFTDWECDVDLNFYEFMSIDDVNQMAEQISEWDDKLLTAVIEYCGGLEEALATQPDEWLLFTNIADDYDLGYCYAVEIKGVDFGENDSLEMYFDFEAYGRDIRLETEGAHTAYGWIEYIKR